jgi:MtN3 and saliva related transmembrane protein
MGDALPVLAAGWGVLMAISPFFQIQRILARRSSADVSIAYLAVLEVGFLLWVAYAISIGNVPLMVPNTIAFVVGAATIAVTLRFRNPRHAGS